MSAAVATSPMSQPCVLVTGGAGYIGSHVCKALAAAGYLPVCYDNMAHGHEWAVRWGPLEQADIADRAALDSVIERYRPVAVLHFAALISVGESVRRPDLYYRNNVAGTLTLLEAVRSHAIGQFIFSSTAAVYGDPQYLPIDEAHALLPTNPYGRSKLMIERILDDFEGAFGLRHVALRYFNAAGADPDGELGESHEPETHLIPLALQSALGEGSGLDIYGTDYATEDGTAVRDYIHVSDLAAAHVQALRYLQASGGSVSLNLGTGRGWTVRQVVEAVERVTGRRPAVRSCGRRVGDPPALVAAAERGQQVLDWQPARPDLESMVADASRWLRAAQACR